MMKQTIFRKEFINSSEEMKTISSHLKEISRMPSMAGK